MASGSGISERDTGSRSIFAQLIRFGIVGVFCAVLDFGTYKALLAFGMDISPWVDVARGISFIVGTTTAYALNKRFTFDATGGIRQLSSFMILYGSTFTVAVGVNSTLLHTLPTTEWREDIAWVISQGTATTINFIMLRLVVFRERSKQTDRSVESKDSLRG
nr:GtrA family protein [Haloechinothrix halophila]